MVTDDVLDPLQRRLRLATLGYLLLYPLPWLQQPPSAAGVAASLAGLGLFLPLYFRAWYVYDWRRLASAASMTGRLTGSSTITASRFMRSVEAASIQ